MRLARLRTAAAVLVASTALTAVAASEASAARVSSKPTGDQSLDDYCRQAADLINEAFAEGDRLDFSGNFAEGQEWWDLGIEMLARARANGCSFAQARVRRLGVTAVRPGAGGAIGPHGVAIAVRGS